MKASRITATAAIAAAALAASIVPASGAFAAGGPTSNYTGVVTVTSTLNIQPSTGSFTLTAIPGTPVSPPPFTITLTSSDSAGYSVTESLPNSFGSIPNPDWSTDVAVAPQGFGAPWTVHATNYDAAGDAITLFAFNGVSGIVAQGGSGPISSVGSDNILNTQVHLALPGSFPGSPAGGYSGAFNYQIIGA